jgi:hypothetical protein
VGAAITAPVLDVTGPMRAPIAGFSIDTVLYSGGTSTLPDSLPYNVLKVGSGTGFPANVVLSGTTVTTGDVLIDGPNGTRLIMNGQQLTVGGDLWVGYPTSGRGHIEMADGADGLLVLGNATFRGASTALQANARWTDGWLEVRGNFEQIAAAGQPHTFQPNAAHQTLFTGGSAQTITFGAADTSRFGGLWIGNTVANVSLTTNAKAIGPVTIATGANLNVGSSTFLASDGGTFNHNDGSAIASTTAGTLDITNAVIGGGSIRGDLEPGGAGAAGALTVNGRLPLDAQAKVTVELGGRNTPGADWDLLTHKGVPSTLNAQLVVTLINGFALQAGDTLPIATFNPASGDPTPLSKFSGGVTLPTQAELIIDTLWSNNATDSDTLYIVVSSATPPPATDGFAAGSGGRWWRYNGDVWTFQGTDLITNMYGLWGTAANDVYAVGASGTIMHYNGTSWSSGTSAQLTAGRAVWGTASNDVFVVGEGGTRIEHNDGTGWSTMTSGLDAGALYGVSGTSSNDVFAVGWDVGATAGIILHYNGTSWSPMTHGATVLLDGVWAAAPNDVFVVGNGGTILRYNGTSWNAMDSGTSENLHDVWGESSSDVFAVGDNGPILHFNGTSWSTTTSGTTQPLPGVWGTSASNVFAVGNNTTFLRYNGSSWVDEGPDVAGGVLDVWVP